MKRFSIAALLLCVLATSANAQARTDTGFYYPTGTANPRQPGGTWLATACDTYNLGDGINRYHLGYDLLQASGQPVHAIADGTIVYVAANSDPDLAFIWIKHQAIDPSNGNTINVWAVYGHTTLASGLANGSIVHGNDVIGYTMPYPASVPHCHFGINRSGIVTNVSNQTINYLDSSGSSRLAQVQVGWGRGAYLPSGWCTYKTQNLSLLQTPPAPGLVGYVDPLNFIRTFRAVGYGSSDTDIYVSTNGSDTNNGSSSSAFRTVARAITQASSSQAVTIHITPGVYSEKISTSKHIHFVTNGSGTVRIGG